MATGQQDPKPLSTMAAIAARAAQREGGGATGGTDDDGNVWVIDVDLDAKTAQISVTTPGGSVTTLSLIPGVATLGALGPGGSPAFAIGVTNPGGISMIGLPTTDPHNPTRVWNDSGTLKLSAG